MLVKILWHRLWVNFAWNGLCEVEGKKYWFSWDKGTEVYKAFNLKEEDFVKLEEELVELEKAYGKCIYHDDRYRPQLTLEDFRKSPGGWVNVAPISESLENLAFSFGRSAVINPVPHTEYYNEQRCKA